MPYREANPRCALSGQTITSRAPLELYHRGRPVSAERALASAPLLVLVRGAVATTSSVLQELGGIGSQLADVDNAELRSLLVERGIGELAKRWSSGWGEVPAAVVDDALGEREQAPG